MQHPDKTALRRFLCFLCPAGRPDGIKDALSLLRAAIKQKRVDDKAEITDAIVVAVIEKMLKQRKDSITQYEAAQRQDLADAEKFEAGVLAGYMPQGLSAAEVESVVVAASPHQPAPPTVNRYGAPSPISSNARRPASPARPATEGLTALQPLRAFRA